jgi:histidine triad (HIT) family protein
MILQERKCPAFSVKLSGELPSDVLYRDDEVIAFRDINPKAPTHILIVPKRHIPSLNELTEEDTPLLGHMVAVAKKLAQDEGILQRGYHLVINCGREWGQIVPHLHMHLLGGRGLSGGFG